MDEESIWMAIQKDMMANLKQINEHLASIEDLLTHHQAISKSLIKGNR